MAMNFKYYNSFSSEDLLRMLIQESMRLQIHINDVEINIRVRENIATMKEILLQRIEAKNG